MNNLEKLPLEGIRVLEFSHMVMGPSCGMILADLGAEVIKVEPQGSGDKSRHLGSFGSGLHITFNRNKKSIAIDIKSPEGKQAIRDLVKSIDIITENFREGALEEQGLGYEDLKTINNRLIYCAMKGFLDGPYQYRTALDEVVQMMGGLAYMTGPPGRPLRAGASVNDIMGGMFGVIGILSALNEREKSGEGAFIKSGLFESCALLMAPHIGVYERTGKPSQSLAARKTQPWPVYDLFNVKNDQQVFIGLVTGSQWVKFCEEFELHNLLNDPGLQNNEDRVANRETILPLLKNLIAEYELEVISARLEKVGCPFAPVAKPEDLIEDVHLKESGGLLPIEIDGKMGSIPGLPLQINGERLPLRSQPPLIGEHSRELLYSIGWSEEDVNRMVETDLLTESLRS